MKKVQSSRKVNPVQIRVQLCDISIKRKYNDKKIRLKTVSNLEKSQDGAGEYTWILLPCYT